MGERRESEGEDLCLDSNFSFEKGSEHSAAKASGSFGKTEKLTNVSVLCS